MATNNNKQGGARVGAGRKPQGAKKMTFSINKDAQIILTQVDNKSKFINDLIIKATI